MTFLSGAVQRLALVAGLSVVLLSCTGAPALADGVASGGDVVVAQTLGDRELTVVLRRVTSVPGPVSVDVITHIGAAPGQLTVALIPTGSSAAASELPAAGVPTGEATIALGAAPGTYSTAVTVDRPGPWELELGDGERTALIPFVVPAQVISPLERVVYGGFIAAGVFLLVAGVVAARARSTGWTLLPAAGVLVGLSMAVTAAVLSTSLPLPPQPGTQLDPTVDNVTNPYALSKPLIVDYSRPPVLLTLPTTPVSTGTPIDLDLGLSDGSTGLPIDDILVHDAALIHLLLVGPTGQLWHLHPIRTAPGHYQQHVTLPVPGHYALSAELVRRGGGVQMVRAAAGLDVTEGPAGAHTEPDTARAATPRPTHLDTTADTADTVVDGIAVTVTTTRPAAGIPVTVAARIGDTADLQPWLGMVGHLIVAGPLPANDSTDVGTAVQSAPIWAHTHSMGGMSMPDGPMPGTQMDDGMDAMIAMNPVNGDSAPDETVAAYGPDVPFTFTFPAAGQYRLWLQVERNYRVLTVPVLLDVTPSAAAPQ
ncbi:hypothetical protein BH09ACT8_BH09ACT8_08540 [soil metagenome]